MARSSPRRMAKSPESETGRSKNAAFRFEELVGKAFQRNEISLQRNNDASRRDYDFIGTSKSNTNAVIEVKYFRSFSVPSKIILELVQRISKIRERLGVTWAVLVLNCDVSADLKVHISKAYADVLIYDFEVISNLVARDQSLQDELRDILSISFPFQSEALPEPQLVSEDKFLGTLSSVSQSVRAHAVPNPGADLCKKLNKTAPGKGKNAAIFEEYCEDCVKYLFDDFSGWERQKKTASDLHRYDLIARNTSRWDFWSSLVTDFRSRYILFEFKNYKDCITQSEVYSTEKYLLPLAMRGTAIIISRKGANSNAIRVAGGALRETGKLILICGIDDVCRMLQLRDEQKDPSIVLQEKLDAVLKTIER